MKTVRTSTGEPGGILGIDHQLCPSRPRTGFLKEDENHGTTTYVFESCISENGRHIMPTATGNTPAVGGRLNEKPLPDGQETGTPGIRGRITPILPRVMAGAIGILGRTVMTRDPK